MAEPGWIAGAAGLAALVAALLAQMALRDGYVRFFLEIGAGGFLC